jgi:hypothetical protein
MAYGGGMAIKRSYLKRYICIAELFLINPLSFASLWPIPISSRSQHAAGIVVQPNVPAERSRSRCGSRPSPSIRGCVDGMCHRAAHDKGSPVSNHPMSRWRLGLPVGVFLAELAHLTWDHRHGGVPSHHLLNNPAWPAVSNWWGALLLPLLTWVLLGRIMQRLANPAPDAGARAPRLRHSGALFGGALLFGILLSIAFTTGADTLAATLFLGMLAATLVVPLYRAEWVLGFVLGMALTFGVVLPTVIGAVVAAVAALIQLVVWPMLVRLWTRIIRPAARPR